MSIRGFHGDPEVPVRQRVGVRVAEPSIIVCVAVVAPLLIPYGAGLVLGGNLLRLMFPAYVMAISLALLRSRRPLYPIFIIAVFAFAAFLRRVADNSGGFVAFNLILVSPYFGLIPTLPAMLRRVQGQRSGWVWPFAIILFCIIYGSFVALLNGAPLVSAFYDPARWLLPVSLCTFIMDDPCQAQGIRRTLVAGLFCILPVLGSYGVYQYIAAPSWDTFWMLNIDNATFGLPEPFMIRVFSMMNSPFAAAAFVAMVMVLLSGEGFIGIMVAATAIPMLALTLVRTGWVGLTFGLFGLFVKATPFRKLLLLFGALGISIGCIALLQSSLISPKVAHVLTDRLSTLQDMKSDGSASVRLDDYYALFDRLADHPFGEGFGVPLPGGSARSLTTVPLDSGVLETYRILGVVTGSAYFVSFGALVLGAFGVVRTSPEGLAGWMALVFSGLIMLLLGSAQIGEVGALEWAALGVILSHSKATLPILQSQWAPQKPRAS